MIINLNIFATNNEFMQLFKYLLTQNVLINLLNRYPHYSQKHSKSNSQNCITTLKLATTICVQINGQKHIVLPLFTCTFFSNTTVVNSF